MDWDAVGKLWFVLLGLTFLAWMGAYVKQKWFGTNGKAD